ncbi:Homeodomain-like DNA binding domain-containing transcription factor [Phycomyces blakesleeanus NRRL 1555(-)]|uniref:Homeodomain-like DNA binding domain-containing transcription factor n=1 Tax=Phycomyces blakesleeanus (strain ATCC 8743b / DSM 1359 / FGSC 10004 / NBRC 33097 / NRRL 1555) TaxID=763407 RepID=A0A162X423_PHYB8|nr:Homeodomain-like DNA binding domain-containing transcription factor [Phycomyces blakesleeanus NRRL 1555(-)]OAD72415.1 Homeodomain-like DNA binding domain-containing transcription factor [Phycomyces blakesleeanus NRRL 1555(-)]|eukprot:XP_018290455.1 Homeodomain-like DNA binding domain-containing transcription factor [Phycomyces blakesleeanus NRRL 1555(-)]
MSPKTIKQSRKKSPKLSDYMKGKIVGAYDFGILIAKIACKYKLSYMTVTTTIERVKKTSTALTKKHKGRSVLLNDCDLRALRNIERNDPTATLDMIAAEI